MLSRPYVMMAWAKGILTETFPGFVVLMIIIGLNYGPVYNILTRQGVTDVSGLAISLITLFASSAVGFLISQIWFKIYHYNREWAKLLGKEPINKKRVNTLRPDGRKICRIRLESKVR
jgi:hypothetical protein